MQVRGAVVRGIFIAGLVAIAAPRLALAQCVINGPSMVCGGAPIQLCAPATPAGAVFEWWGDNNVASDQPCITVTAPGTYWLAWYDPSTGWWHGPCSKTITGGVGAPAASITGPASVCDGQPAALCGPVGDFAYSWSGPAGFTSGERCVTVLSAGDYQLVLSPAAGGCPGASATHSLAVNGVPTASINGPSAGCDNLPAELCGPDGNYTFAWTGPAGFAAATRCVSVQTSGDYALVVTSASGCSSSPAVHKLTLTACPTDPPPPAANCPRPPSWWLRQCNQAYRRSVDPTAVARVAACVDQASTALNFSVESFSRTMAYRFSLRARAKRHFAAVHANVCAGEMGLEVLRGPAVRLSRSAQVSLPGVSTTVGEWLDGVNSQLLALESRSLFDKEVRRQYAEIVRVGWMIDHGRGLGPTCTEDAAKVLAEDVNVEVEMADAVASLDLAVAASGGGSAEVEYTVSSESNEEVSIAVFDVAGRRVAELARGPHAPGMYRVRWNGSGSGVYFVRGRIGDQAFTQSRVAIVR